MLELKNIEVIYSDVILVLKGTSLEVPEGKIVALLGANGAGKTTTLKATSGVLRTELGEVTDGSIEFEDERLDRLDPDEIGYSLQVVTQHGLKNVFYCHGISSVSYLPTIAEFSDSNEFISQSACIFSLSVNIRSCPVVFPLPLKEKGRSWASLFPCLNLC